MRTLFEAQSGCAPSSRLRVQRWLLTACAALLVTACGGSGDSGDDSGTGVDPAAPQATVTGAATDARTGAPLSGATVRVGAASTTTDASGRFTVKTASLGERVVVQAEAAGYAPNFESTRLAADATSTVRLQLLPEDARQSFDAAASQVVNDDTSPAQVSLPAGAYVDAAGQPYTGRVTVQLAVIDPASNLAAMPGELIAATGSTTAPMESFGALSVRLTNDAGAELNLAAGRTATIRIPVRTRTAEAALPATMPLFYFDEARGLWVEEGSATLAADRSYYEGQVSHFSVWNADRVLETVLYRGCVVDLQGGIAAGVVMVSEGIDYSGSASVTTDAQGCFALPMRRGGRAVISGSLDALLTNALPVGPSEVDLDERGTALVLGSQQASFVARLVWGTRPFDVDSHLFLPDGSHVYFGSKGSLGVAPYAALDVDDTLSFGPEVLTVRRVMKGRYVYAVDNYSATNDPGLKDSPIRVELLLGAQTIVLTPSSPDAGDLWNAFEVTVDANCRLSWQRLDNWVKEPEVAPVQPEWCD